MLEENKDDVVGEKKEVEPIGNRKKNNDSGYTTFANVEKRVGANGGVIFVPGHSGCGVVVTHVVVQVVAIESHHKWMSLREGRMVKKMFSRVV